MATRSDHLIHSVEELEALYERGPVPVVLRKELDHVPTGYRVMIEASPFMVLATVGPGGLDASPRGGNPGFVKVIDEKTLYLPDNKGNNRLDSMRNLLTDPRIGMLIFVPGFYETLRVHGTATITTDPRKLALFEGKPPLSVLDIRVESVFFQCSKATLRAELWEPKTNLKELLVVKRELNDLFQGLKDSPEKD